MTLKTAYMNGARAACLNFKVKQADQTPVPEGSEDEMAFHQTTDMPVEGTSPADQLAEVLQQIDPAQPSMEPMKVDNRMDRQTVWGNETSTDAGNNLSAMSDSTGLGGGSKGF